jgi:hypothetical protein
LREPNQEEQAQDATTVKDVNQKKKKRRLHQNPTGFPFNSYIHIPPFAKR